MIFHLKVRGENVPYMIVCVTVIDDANIVANDPSL